MYQEADICNAYWNTLSSDVGTVTCHDSDTPICNWLHGQCSLYKFQEKGGKRKYFGQFSQCALKHGSDCTNMSRWELKRSAIRKKLYQAGIGKVLVWYLPRAPYRS